MFSEEIRCHDMTNLVALEFKHELSTLTLAAIGILEEAADHQDFSEMDADD